MKYTYLGSIALSLFISSIILCAQQTENNIIQNAKKADTKSLDAQSLNNELINQATYVSIQDKGDKGNYINLNDIYKFNYGKHGYKVPALPYSYDALEPYIDKETMKIHHNNHHTGYVTKLNAALSNRPDLQQLTLKELLTQLNDLDAPEDIREKIRQNGGGHFNHSFFWNIMKPHNTHQPEGLLSKAITETFGSYDNFKTEWKKATEKVFGSGWTWLSLDENGDFVIHVTKDQNTPLELNLRPLLGLDEWEHAYYLKYQNKRPEYVENWFNVINWPYVENLYEDYTNALSDTSNN